MEKETCILCSRPCSLGLHVMGCLICFPCEKRLVRSCVPPRRGKRLIRLYAPRYSASS